MSLHETLNKIRSAPVPNNEETAKFQIIAPVLNSLGWDPFGQDVRYEHPVGGKGGGKVDIALIGPSRVVAMIEAKSPGENLQRHVDQIVGYAFREGADICALTNGVEWWLYLPMERVPFEQRRFAVLNTREDPIDQLADDFTTFLGKDNLLSRQAEHRARQVLKAIRDADHLKTLIPRVWKQILTEPDEELLDLVSRRVYETANLRPSRKQVAAVLRGLPVPPAPPGPTSGPTQNNGPAPGPQPELILMERDDDATGKRARAFELWGHRYEVKAWGELLVGIAEVLHKRHGADFDQILNAEGNHNTVPMATRDPDAVRRPAQVGATGIYLNIGLHAKSAFRRACIFLEVFGHNKSDLRIWGEEVQPLSGTKPTAVELWGEKHPVNSWSRLIVAVAEALHRRHGPEFNRILELRGRRHPMASRNREELPMNPKLIGRAGIYVETGMSATAAQRRVYVFLEHFGHPASDLEVMFD